MTADSPAAAPQVPPPGWYLDPYGSPSLRWWDGRYWTHHRRPPPPRPPGHAGHNERMGRHTMLAEAILSVVLTAAHGYVLARFIRELGPYLERAQTSPPGQVPPLPASFAMLAVMAVVGLLAWIPLALELTWSYRSASAAAALGIPAKREPIWAVVGWFVPVINWWFPYESIRDCLPPGHPHRRTVGRWWAGHLTGSTGVVAGVVAALFSTTALVAVVLVYAGIAAYTATNGLRMVRAIDTAHRERLAEADH